MLPVLQTGLRILPVPNPFFWVLHIFTKLHSALAAHLHQGSIVVFLYLGDWFFRGQSTLKVQLATSGALALFQSLGLRINRKKPTLTLVQRRDYWNHSSLSNHQSLHCVLSNLDSATQPANNCKDLPTSCGLHVGLHVHHASQDCTLCVFRRG